VLDPRSTDPNSKLSVQAHDGIKTHKTVWLDNEHLATTGFSKTNERQVRLWDTRNFTKEVQTLFIDNAGGIIYPYFDLDTNMLYCPGKGEGNIKYFEYSNHSIGYLNNFSSTVPQKSLCFFPKRAMNYFKSEQARVAKLTNNTIEYVSFNVPKRNEGYHADMYVEVLTGESALTLEEWSKGENKEALRKPIDKIESGWSIKETKFEHSPSKEVITPETEIANLKEEIHKRDDIIHLLEVDNTNLKDLVTHTEEKLNNALSELALLKGDHHEHSENCHHTEQTTVHTTVEHSEVKPEESV